MLIIFECSIKDGFRHIWALSQRFSHTLTFFKVENMFSFLRIDMIYSRTFTFEVSSGMMLWWANWTWFIQPFYTHIYIFHNMNCCSTNNHRHRETSFKYSTTECRKLQTYIYTKFIISAASWWTRTIIYQTNSTNIIPHHLCMYGVVWLWWR